jgi:hypothetical protein
MNPYKNRFFQKSIELVRSFSTPSARQRCTLVLVFPGDSFSEPKHLSIGPYRCPESFQEKGRGERKTGLELEP